MRTRRDRKRTPLPSIRCPTCRAPMRRREYAMFSGVEVDLCSSHGWWFDAGELEGIDAFVRDGGMEEARRRAKKSAAARRRRRAIRRRRRREREVPDNLVLATLALLLGS